jgi:hypothetical protein
MMLLHPKQKEIASSKARFKVVRAGRRFGKTIVKTETMFFKAVARSIRLARKVDNRSVIFIAPTQKQARTIVWETFRQRMNGIAQFNESRLEIKVPTEDGGVSTIFVGGWENRENYRGMPNVVHIEFDEVDTDKDFFIGWQEIFRPMLIDTGGSAGFGGTPKKENPNLRRLEKQYKDDPEWQCFHYTTYDNPYVPQGEIEKARLEMDADTFRQEIMAEHVDNAGSLFKYTALIDMFSNTITKSPERFLIVDVADDGSDKTVFSMWQGLEMYRIDQFERLNTEGIINQTREFASQERIPFSQIAVDAIGVGAGVASSSLLDGIVGFKSSYGAMRTDQDPTRLPNVHYRENAPLISEYKNLRSQCVFTLADMVNNHKIACRIEDLRVKERIIEELALYQDASTGDGKRFATPKEDLVALLGRSPDLSDTLIMRMYFEIRAKLSPVQSEEAGKVQDKIMLQFRRNESLSAQSSTE